MATNDPTQVVQYQTGYAPEVQQYAETTLGRSQALLDLPYQSYSDWAKQQGLAGDQNAQFSDLQNTSFNNAANLGINPYSQNAATGLQNTAQQAAGTQYGPSNYAPQQFTDPNVAAQYMNPYLQQSLAPQIQMLQEQQGMQQAANQGQATQAGAFGGSRMGVQNAQQNQANQLAMSNLIGQGYNTAFGQAQNQFNAAQGQQQQANQLNEQSKQYGAALGLQGLQAAGQIYGTLGQAGQNLYGQNVGNLSLQNQLGTQQQQQAQNMLNTSQQNYLAQQNDPYNRLNFMTGIMKGTPTQTTGSQLYQAAPNMLGQVAGVGAALKGFGLKKGGRVNAGLPHLLASTIG